MRAPNVWTIPPACPFLDTFVQAFLAGDIVPGLSASDDPLWLADARIYVPTQRAARGLAESFRRHAAGPSMVLPRILPLGALEATEPELIFATPDAETAEWLLPPAASSIWRRLQLANLIKRWAEAIRGALCSVDKHGVPVIDETEAFRVATSTADAFALAGDLARLIDELRIEGVEWRALDDLRMAEFDEYWRVTTTFLSIAISQWPEVLKTHALVDRSERQIELVAAQTRALGEGTAVAPVVAIGSTGTNRATAQLLAAIARAPNGAVVLPGLDQDLDDAAWTIVSGQLALGQEPSFGHPQAAMARLLPILGVARAEVRVVGTPEPDLAVRSRFVAEAMRPADTTERWRGWLRDMPRGELAAALDDVSLIEASDEREEALCLAIAMREVLETPGRSAALVTPDRELARRVRGELLRWNIEVTDTGGEPLANRPLGVTASLVLAAAAGRLAAREVGALLAHPLATFGRPRAEMARLARKLEVGVLRAVPLDGKDGDQLVAAARTEAASRHAHPAQKAVAEADWTAIAAFWRDLAVALAPLTALLGEQPLREWVAAHRAAMAAVTADAEVAAEEADALDGILAELEAEAGDRLTFDAQGYGVLFGRLAYEVTLPNTERPHPCLQIFGLLEARLMRADVMLLGGLDETIWPPQAQADPFLNRPMRHELGLSSPERRIGQTAHDFSQAMGHRTVILSRAMKRGGSPTGPSRFLLRLGALGGRDWEGCRTRGQRVLGFARALDTSARMAVPARRPSPTPPLELRPAQLSVTQIETLRRDPYAIYASRILRLAPLPQADDPLAASEFGSRMHEALHEFATCEAAQGSAEVRRAAMHAIARRVFGTALDDPMFAAFRWPIVAKSIELFLGYDATQRAMADDIAVETDGRLSLVLADSTDFRLTARADRIDRHRDGLVTLIDYKTGQAPSVSEVRVGFAPQLTLEAAMLREGGFGPPHRGAVAATYLKLGGKNGGFIRPLTFDSEEFADVVDRHFAGLKQLLSSFRNPETGYPSRPFPKYAKRFGDFDHLARVREWSLAADEESAP